MFCLAATVSGGYGWFIRKLLVGGSKQSQIKKEDDCLCDLHLRGEKSKLRFQQRTSYCCFQCLINSIVPRASSKSKNSRRKRNCFWVRLLFIPCLCPARSCCAKTSLTFSALFCSFLSLFLSPKSLISSLRRSRMFLVLVRKKFLRYFSISNV